jgi:hypothetical protein
MVALEQRDSKESQVLLDAMAANDSPGYFLGAHLQDPRLPLVRKAMAMAVEAVERRGSAPISVGARTSLLADLNFQEANCAFRTASGLPIHQTGHRFT